MRCQASKEGSFLNAKTLAPGFLRKASLQSVFAESEMGLLCPSRPSVQQARRNHPQNSVRTSIESHLVLWSCLLGPVLLAAVTQRSRETVDLAYGRRCADSPGSLNDLRRGQGDASRGVQFNTPCSASSARRSPEPTRAMLLSLAASDGARRAVPPPSAPVRRCRCGGRVQS